LKGEWGVRKGSTREKRTAWTETVSGSPALKNEIRGQGNVSRLFSKGKGGLGGVGEKERPGKRGGVVLEKKMKPSREPRQ